MAEDTRKTSKCTSINKEKEKKGKGVAGRPQPKEGVDGAEEVCDLLCAREKRERAAKVF